MVMVIDSRKVLSVKIQTGIFEDFFLLEGYKIKFVCKFSLHFYQLGIRSCKLNYELICRDDIYLEVGIS